jgi:hypothetical protein
MVPQKILWQLPGTITATHHRTGRIIEEYLYTRLQNKKQLLLRRTLVLQQEFQLKKQRTNQNTSLHLFDHHQY